MLIEFGQVIPPDKIQALFLDRDGTINIDHGYISRIEDFVFVPGALEALKIVVAQAIPIHIVTNQAGIARGLYTDEQYQKLTAWMLTQLATQGIVIREVLHCPHHAQGSIPEYTQLCDCRKPAPGMILGALKREGYEAAQTVMIGDKLTDVAAGRAAGARTILLDSSDATAGQNISDADLIVKDLRAAVKCLLGE